jgi:hypothetical protein
MGKNIKIELELPEFDKELAITVTLKRDGEVIKASSSPGVNVGINNCPPLPTAQPIPTQNIPPRQYDNGAGGGWKQGGNMMDINF